MPKEHFKLSKIILSISVLLLTIPLISLGEERSIIPHQFNSGDVISADIINEVFDSIGDVTDGFISPAELVGTWACTIFDSSPEPQYLSYYTLHSSGVLYVLTDTITFTDNGDGTYSYATATYNFYYPEIGYLLTPESGTVWTMYNRLITKQTDGSTRGGLIQKISADTFVWDYNNSSSHSRLILCERLNLPPAIPTDLSATVSGLSVVLTWMDNSTLETGFKVSRKDTLEGEYAEIGTTSANTTSYTDTLTTSGTYWYRVMATNANGDSLGSNEAMVTVSE